MSPKTRTAEFQKEKKKKQLFVLGLFCVYDKEIK